MNKRTQARRQWTEHYSALQETSAWCIDRGWPHVIEWVTSHSFQHESYVTLGCILQDASTKIFPFSPSPLPPSGAKGKKNNPIDQILQVNECRKTSVRAFDLTKRKKSRTMIRDNRRCYHHPFRSESSLTRPAETGRNRGWVIATIYGGQLNNFHFFFAPRVTCNSSRPTAGYTRCAHE